MQMIINGLLTNYSLVGSGKLVVLIHGWGSDLQSFQNLSKELSKEYMVLAIDLPGMGGTDSPNKPWELIDFASFIKAASDKLQLPHPYAILGHSNGGAISIKMIASGLSNPKKLILLGSSGIRDKDRPKKKLITSLAKAGKKATYILPKSSQDKIKSKLYSSIGSEGLLIPGMEQTFRNIVNEDVQDLARTIKIPTLLIYGEDDTSTPPEYGEYFASAIRGSKLEIIKGAGHFAHQDQPKEATALMKEFLK